MMTEGDKPTITKNIDGKDSKIRGTISIEKDEKTQSRRTRWDCLRNDNMSKTIELSK